ncbi:hypothetical protein V2J09_015252 [Rumex salicifolius]
MEGSNIKSAQISDMWNKFALSFKSKAFEFFSEDAVHETSSSGVAFAADDDDPETFTPLEDAGGVAANQKVVVIKPESPQSSPSPLSASNGKKGTINPQFNQTLISSLLATISSIEASYLQLQTAHVPFDEEAIRVADKALVSHLQTLSEFKQLYKHYYANPNLCIEFSTGSCLEFQVNENQTKLRALKSVFNRLQSEIDVKDEEVSGLRRKLEDLQRSNSMLSNRLNCCSERNREVLSTVQVFDALLQDAFRLTRKFTKLLISLMKEAEWDLDLAANSVYSGVSYAKKGHNKYALLSYVCLRMFHGFDSIGFSLDENGEDSASLKRLIQHISINPMELLSKEPSCEFSRFCEAKYQQLIHPTMESLIFSDLDQNGEIVNSWKSLTGFYESFVKMASALWTLHNLAFSFDPPVRIFQVESGVDFSFVYMEDVTGKCKSPCRTRPKVGFTVVPGFKIGQTVIQSKFGNV